MLQGTLAFLVLVVLAVVGGEAQQRLAQRSVRAPALEGLAFLVLGAILGEFGLGLFPADVLEVLRAVVLVGLAWIGLVYGLQVDVAIIQRLRPWHRLWGLGVPTTVGLTLLGAASALGMRLEDAAGVAVVGAISSTVSLDSMAWQRRPRDRGALRVLRMVAALSGLPAILGLAFITAGWSPVSTAAGGWVPWWELLVVMVGGGVVLGYTLLSLIRGLSSPLQLLTLLVGLAAILAGAGAVLGLSAVPSAAVAGAVIINRSVFPHRLLKAAHGFERPLVVVMLVLVGASVDAVHFSWLAFVILTAVRLGVLAAAGRALASQARREGSPVTSWIGLGLLPQEALALGLAVAVDVATGGGRGILEATVLAMVVNQAAAQWWLRRALFEPAGKAAGA